MIDYLFDFDLIAMIMIIKAESVFLIQIIDVWCIQEGLMVNAKFFHHMVDIKSEWNICLVAVYQR